MYKLIPWTKDLDLSDFYNEALRREFHNNSSEKLMINCFDNEKHKQVWILYYNNQAVGSVGAHSLPELGSNAYRIAARTCTFTDKLPGTYGNGLHTITDITTLQNPTAQFFLPACIDWAPKSADLYITSFNGAVGTQRLIHKIACPALEKISILTKACDIEYRGHLQTFWKLNVDLFNKQLSRYTRWI